MSRDLLKRTRLLLVLGCLLAFPSTLAAQVERALEDRAVSEILSGLQGTAESVITSAGNEGKYLIQQSAMEALIAIQTLDSVLKDQQDRAWKELDESVQNSIRQIEKALTSLEDGLLEYQDFLYLDASSLLDRIPLLRKGRSLRSIGGISQAFKTKGAYQFRLVGSAFGPEAKVAVSLGRKTIPAAAIQSSRMYEVRFSVPVGDLNGYFDKKGDKVVLVPMRVRVYEDRRRLFSRLWHPFESHERVELFAYRMPIRLLPKTAVPSYSLVEIQHAVIPGDPVWSEWGPTVEKSRVGRDCCKHCDCAKRAQVCAVIPKNAELVLDKGHPVVETWEGGKCDSFCDFIRKPRVEAGKVCQEWRNWRKSYGGSARLRFQYRPLRAGTKRVTQKLVAIGSATEVDRLEFGRLYEVEFSPQYGSFNLILELFNGDQAIVTPKQGINDKLARFSLDRLGGTVNRLLLSLGGS